MTKNIHNSIQQLASVQILSCISTNSIFTMQNVLLIGWQ